MVVAEIVKGHHMVSRQDVITHARGWIGTPYCHQASLKSVGCDCLGLIRGVWRELYGREPEDMPAYSPDWAEAGHEEALAMAASRHMSKTALNDFKPGDMMLFRWRDHLPAKHAGIVTDNNHLVHAQEGACVSEIALTPWWLKRLAFVFRFPEG